MRFVYLFLFVLIICININGQTNKNEGKLRIRISNFNQLALDSSFLKDSCTMYIYQGEEIRKIINVSKLLFYNIIDTEQIFKDIYLNEGSYFVLIENLNAIPILFTNVMIKKRKLTFLVINIAELQKAKSSKPRIIIKDYTKYFQEYLKENPPIVK